MRCPQCHKDNLTSYRFCISCGSTLDLRDIKPADTTQNSSGLKGTQPSFCNSCGHKVKTGYRFCQSCGKELLPVVGIKDCRSQDVKTQDLE
jgi:predicted amidophosphoribosyltransferase